MNEEKQDTKKTDWLKWVIVGLTGFVAVVLIFSAGMFVGGMKARFSYRWAESYHKNFAGPRGGFFDNWRQLPSPTGNFIKGHGTFGEIIQINPSANSGQTDLVIKGQGDLEKIIILKENTILEKGRTAIKKDDLKVGDQVVIIGSPNEEGQIEAKLIRVFPPKTSFREPKFYE